VHVQLLFDPFKLIYIVVPTYMVNIHFIKARIASFVQ